MVLRYVGRLGAQSGKPELYGADPLASCQVDQWLERSTSVVPGQGFEAVCGSVNDFLALRTYLAGYVPTVADFAVWGQLQGAEPGAGRAGHVHSGCNRARREGGGRGQQGGAGNAHPRPRQVKAGASPSAAPWRH
jgi:hypothetical protein